MKAQLTAKVVFFYGIGVLLCSSRGVFELLASKTIGYALQLATLIFLALILYKLFFFRKLAIKSPAISLFWCIVATLMLSLGVTILDGENSAAQAIVVMGPNLLNIFFLAAAFCIATDMKSPEYSASTVRMFTWVIVSVSLYVSILSILQYAGVLEFPGDIEIGGGLRLSGPLGSKQHLSLVVAVLGLILLSIVSRSPSFLNITAFLINLFVLLFCFTRIGYFVFFAAVLIWACMNGKRLLFALLSRKGAAALISGIVVLVIASSYFDKEIETFADRADVDVGDRSNTDRLGAWRLGLDFYSNETTLIISNRMGSASQIPAQILNIPVYNVESGQIQYLINFGLLPFILINLTFAGWFFLSPRAGVAKGIPVAMSAALFIYMFNEIVPVFVLFPLVAMEQRIFAAADRVGKLRLLRNRVGMPHPRASF